MSPAWGPSGGLLGGAVGFVQIMRELDLDEIRRQLALPVRVLVTGPELGSARELAERLLGTNGLSSWSVAVAALGDEAVRHDRPDLALLAVPPGADSRALLARYRERREHATVPVVVVLLGETGPALPLLRTGDELARLVAAPTEVEAGPNGPIPSAVLDLVPNLALALGRRFPAFRPTVTERLIRETSRANAQFALVSSLPANLPLVGGLIGDAADMLVLTKNQGLLVYKLAGLYRRDLDDRVALAIEIAPVVGGAFFWRSVARALLGLLPTLIGGLPKAAVAYAGTYAVGEIASYYYSTGHHPPPELTARFQAEGARLAGEVVARLRDWRQPRG